MPKHAKRKGGRGRRRDGFHVISFSTRAYMGKSAGRRTAKSLGPRHSAEGATRESPAGSCTATVDDEWRESGCDVSVVMSCVGAAHSAATETPRSVGREVSDRPTELVRARAQKPLTCSNCERSNT